MPDSSERNICICIWIVVAVISLLLFILLPVSFSDLEFYEFGFKRRKSTGNVDTDTVYGPGGRYLVGPDIEFKTFKASAHFVLLDDATVFTSDRLEVHLTCSFQYFLMKDELPLLHDAYDIFYEPILENNAKDALKGAATVFSTREFIRQREIIENALQKAVTERLGGRCCFKGCNKRGDCIPGCKAYDQCLVNDKGLFAEVRFFQLGQVKIPGDIADRFLSALILNEDTEKEKFYQEATVVRKQTEAEVEIIKNKAIEVKENADAQAKLRVSKAHSNASSIIEKARYDGLKLLYSKTGVGTQEHKSSFDYLRTLKDQKNVHLSVNFDQMIMAGKDVF